MKMIDGRRLARAPPFRHLDPLQLRRVLAEARAHHLVSGAVVLHEGQPVINFHLLLSGNIRLVRLTEEGERIILLHVAAGEVFGIGLPLGPAFRQETAIAANECEILSWPGALWQSFTRLYEGFGCETLRTFGARSDAMSDYIVELSSKRVEQRIAGSLLRLSGQSGRKISSGVEIVFPLTRQHIADMTGTTLHTASRVLSGWERQGLIESVRCHIVVTDPHRLVMINAATGRGAADLDGSEAFERKNILRRN